MNRLNAYYAAWAGLAAVIVSLTGCGGDPVTQMPPLPVQVTEAVRQDVPLSIDMVGATLGSQDVPIRARVEGFLDGMYFREGGFVKKGDQLYLIDPQPFRAKLTEAESELAGARTRLANAQADLGRIRPLAEMKAVSEQDLDSAVAMEQASQAGVQAAEARVELALIEMSYTDIRAPIDGLIGLTKARPGEFVGREPNPVVLNTLSDIDPIRVRFSISEREYLILARTYLQDGGGQEGRRQMDLEPDQRRDLTLILADGTEHSEKGWAVAVSQSINAETGTYSIEAIFPNPSGLLLPGQFARVRAPYQDLENVVVIPRKALIELQGLFQVYVVKDDNTVEIRVVTPGPIKGNEQVIESGLEGGESIIVEGIQKVRGGMTVNPSPYSPAAQRAPVQET
jgi:membrane fusion protein (multidrug efflux system)